MTASGGAAADLHMPSAEVARPGAVRRAEAARANASGAPSPSCPSAASASSAPPPSRSPSDTRARPGTDYQSNGGALVRVTVRFVDWLDPAPAADAPTAVTLAVPAMHLGAAPLAKLGDGECALGAAVYRLGAPPAGVEAVPAKARPRRSPRHRGEARRPSAEKLAGGAALIYVGKVLK